MAEKLEIYKCEACGNIVEVIHGGAGELVCCGESMILMVENTVDAAKGIAVTLSGAKFSRSIISPRMNSEIVMT